MQGLQHLTTVSYDGLAREIASQIEQNSKVPLFAADIIPQLRMQESYGVSSLPPGAKLPSEIGSDFVAEHRLGGSTPKPEGLIEVLQNLRKYSQGQRTPPDHVVFYKARRMEWETAEHPWKVWFRND